MKKNYELSRIIKSARIEKGISQREFALALGTNVSVVAQWENHGIEPSASFIRDINLILGVVVDYLLDLN
ncbi:MAG: helix-turn-helix domain-containing protein [Clostridiales bacterium]|jgi:transcriptional regulator with XRE-family HTH domain|nr:helix-turn-helix domain-containing protein [Clostridiales bacterium]